MAFPRTSWAVALFVLCSVLVLALTVDLADEASARTIMVPEDQPSIMQAVNAAMSGDTVLVSHGDYEEDIQISRSIIIKGVASHMVVLSNPGQSTVVKITSPGVTLSNFKIEGSGGQIGVHVYDADYVTLDGLRIVNCEMGILAEYGRDLSVQGCTIEYSATAGLKVMGTPEVRYEQVTVSDSVLEDTGGHGVWLLYCRYVHMDRLTVRSNSGDGIQATTVGMAHLRNSTLNANWNGLALLGSHGWTVEDSTFQNNKQNGIELNQSGADIDNQLRRNLITDNSKATGSSAAGILFYGHHASDNLVEHNIIRSNPIGINFISRSGGCWHNTFLANRIASCSYGIWENSGTGPNDYVLNNFEGNSIIVAAVNALSDFDDGELGNYWSDYLSKYPLANKDGVLWTTPYQVKLGMGVYDMFPLAYRYEQDPPVIDTLALLEGEVMVPGYPATFGAGAHDASAIAGYRWTVLPIKGPESSYTTAGHTFTFTFKEMGLHWLTVEVTDVWGAWASLSRPFNVEDPFPPVAEAGPDVAVGLGSTVTLDGTASYDNYGIASISWVFDPDGLNLRFSTSYATFTINELGEFQAVLFVVDYAGNSDTDRVFISVKDLSPPHAVTSGDAAISLGEKYTLDGSSSSDNVGITQWRWAINRNGNLLVTIVEAVFEYTFTELGKYEVTLTVKDAAGNEDRDTFYITVLDTDPPMAMAGRDQEVLMGAEVMLDATSSTDNVGITRYQWSFHYGPKTQYLFGSLVTWRFDLPGTYLVTLAVFDAAGNHDSDMMTVTIIDTDPPVARYWISEDMKLGHNIVMDASGSEDNVGITAVEWHVTHKGTTTVLRDTMVEMPIEEPGTYKVTLVVRDAAGNEATEDWSFYVAPKASEADVPSWLVPGMVAVLAAAMLVGYVYARRRYMT